MMDAAEWMIPQRVNLEKKPCVVVGDVEIPKASVIKVLDDDNLLREIIVRVGFPTTLVCAALVCKRWLQHTSDSKFLSRFRKLHPPRLLGYYITDGSTTLGKLDAPRFVPMLPHPPELSTVIRRLERYDFGKNMILECWNDNIFTRQQERVGWGLEVHRPLCTHTAIQIVPPIATVHDDNNLQFSGILYEKESSGFAYMYVSKKSLEKTGKAMVRVYMLQDGVWRVHTSATCLHVLHFGQNPLLVGNKIYVPSSSSQEIIVLDSTTSSFSTIQLPHGVEYSARGTRLSQADDASSFHFIHVKEFQLHVWLHQGENWLLVDTICLHEMLAVLGVAYHTLEDGGVPKVGISYVGDNGQFVFLWMGQCLFYLDIKCRKPSKVFQYKVNDRYFCSLGPFMMIWPPTFPVLKNDPARYAI